MIEQPSTFNTGSSAVVDRCQVCGGRDLQAVLFLGYMPPVNQMRRIGEQPREQPSYPAQLLYCPKCHLVQLGLIVDAKILFPKEYPYTSSTTKILRDNFAELAAEAKPLLDLRREDLMVDVGSNDGNLLVNFKDACRVLGVTPEDIGKIAVERGVPTMQAYFSQEVVERIKKEHGPARVVSATNVFAHIEQVNAVMASIKDLLREDGVFISESHYLLPLIETLQFDTIYHEHLRYYSLHSLSYLLKRHGLEVFQAKRIPTHGGSIRVYAGRPGLRPIHPGVGELLQREESVVIGLDNLRRFRDRSVLAKLRLQALLGEVRARGRRVFGVSAPSRATTLVNWAGIDDGTMEKIVEVEGSHKIGKYLPGTMIPIVEEKALLEEQPDFALLLSWHIADELMPKIRKKGFLGRFIVPLPEARIVEA